VADTGGKNAALMPEGKTKQHFWNGKDKSA
jgi:hypothetical protein